MSTFSIPEVTPTGTPVAPVGAASHSAAAAAAAMEPPRVVSHPAAAAPTAMKRTGGSIIRPREFRSTTVSSLAAFGIGFGRESKTDKPIKAYDCFTADDGVPEVDQDYVFQPDVTRNMLMAMMRSGKVYALGPTGSGKTTLFSEFAARTGRPMWRQQFYQEQEVSELTGTWTVVEGGNMEYLYSGLAMAIQLPSVVILDEFDSGNPSVTAVANALLEGAPLVIPQNGGEKIIPHPDCLIVATGNTNGMGDESGLYTSTTVQSFATMNRFKMFLPIDYMKAEDEEALLVKKFGSTGVPPAEITEMVKVANLIRDAFVSQKITAVMSTRQLVNWCEWLVMTGQPSRSFALAFSNQLGVADRAVVDELYQRVYGTR